MQFSLTGRIARSRMTWAGHVVRMQERQVTWCGWRSARSRGADGGAPTTKESRGSETAGYHDKQQTAVKTEDSV